MRLKRILVLFFFILAFSGMVFTVTGTTSVKGDSTDYVIAKKSKKKKKKKRKSKKKKSKKRKSKKSSPPANKSKNISEKESKSVKTRKLIKSTELKSDKKQKGYSEWVIGLAGQLNITRYSGGSSTDSFSPRPGGGILGEYWLNKEMAISMWLYYTQKQFKTETGTGRADFVSIPLGFQYRIDFLGAGLFFNGGPYLDLVLSTEYEETSQYNYVFEFDGFNTISSGLYIMIGGDIDIGFGSLFLQTGWRHELTEAIKGESNELWTVEGGGKGQEISIFFGYKVGIDILFDY